jgi:hypothetical protein
MSERGEQDFEALPEGNVASQDRSDWQHWVERAQQYVDPWGNVLDPGIQAVVAALWAHGFSTRWSCEGHTDGRLPGPFVTIAFDQSQDLPPLDELQLRAMLERVRLQGLLDAYRGKFQPLQPETELILVPVIYRSHGRRFARCAFTLRSAGAHPCSRFANASGLVLFRDEMARFAGFLPRFSV